MARKSKLVRGPREQKEKDFQTFQSKRREQIASGKITTRGQRIQNAINTATVSPLSGPSPEELAAKKAKKQETATQEQGFFRKILSNIQAEAKRRTEGPSISERGTELANRQFGISGGELEGITPGQAPGLGEIAQLAGEIGPLVGIAGIGGGAGSGRFINNVERAQIRTSAAKIAARFGKPSLTVRKQLNNAKVRQSIKDLTDSTPSSFTKKLGTGIATLASVDVLASWAALDNGIGGQKFFTNELRKGVESGEIDPSEAQERIQNSLETKDQLLSFLRISTRINPLLMPFGGTLIEIAETDSELIEANIETINQIAATQQETGEVPQTFQEQQATRDAERDERFNNQ